MRVEQRPKSNNWSKSWGNEMATLAGVTSIDGRDQHGHGYKIDEFGNGQTVDLIGSGVPHTHSIVNREVRPSGADNHVHKLMHGKPGQEDA